MMSLSVSGGRLIAGGDGLEDGLNGEMARSPEGAAGLGILGASL